MTYRSTYYVIALVALCGCSTALGAGRHVRVAKSAHRGCRELGIVMGSGGGGGWTSSKSKMESAHNELRNEAARKGGNLVVLDASAGDIVGMSLSGRAFHCGRRPTAVPVRVVSAPRTRKARRALQPRKAPTTEARLIELRGLLDKGLITQEEHDARRSEILQSI